MRTLLKRSVLVLSKYLGLFAVTRYLTRRGLRVLCYHGMSLHDEHLFRPKMFMQTSTLAARLAFLRRKHFPVLGLGDAVDRLRAGSLPPGSVVITIDDGFHGTYRAAWPLLRALSLPATVYVTSYYVLKQNPVFGLVVEYIFWKTSREQLDLDGLGVEVSGVVSLREPRIRARITDRLVQHGELRCSEGERYALARELAGRLGVDFDVLARRRMFCLMAPAEIRELAQSEIDVQLHTHRHRFPEEQTAALRELADNRSTLESLGVARLEHFCYPSGEWSPTQWPVLEQAGVKTATTCEAGFNYPDTPRWALRRFLDGDDIAAIEFEAELSGYFELLRQGRRIVSRALGA